MRKTRIYLDHTLRTDMTCILPDETTHHIAHVLRMKPGQPVIIFNGQGGEYEAEIIRIERRQAQVLIGKFLNQECESCLDITLVQGISRSNRMDYTLQKAVELGVNRIVPVLSRYSHARIGGSQQKKRYQHWQRIVISACEQCGRNRLPFLENPVTFNDFLEDWKADGLKIILHPAVKTRLAYLDVTDHSLALAAGPEGGFSDDEIASAEKKGYRPVALGPRMLRTETAALAAISACQALWGDMGG
jgi:16S rRNA (uracil1498-N3)-methyltransferase